MNAPVIEKRFREPNLVAKLNRQRLNEAKVFTVNVVGGPGCGKTSLIDSTIEHLKPDVNVGVIACDLTSHRDADRMIAHSPNVVQVNTGERGMPDATDLRAALDCLDLENIELLFIENVGALIGPVALDLGQDVTAAVFSVAGGHDKADKHAPLVQGAGVVVLNKTDLLSAVPFDLDTFRADVQRLNPHAPLCELSALRESGMDTWFAWLKFQVANERTGDSKWFG
jgi:hydrogenase nickel incorporation protein HypB